MITISNYRERIGEIGVANLNPTLKEGHDFLKEVSSDFKDWSLYEEDDEIRETIDIYLNKLNSFYSLKQSNRDHLIKDFYHSLNTFQKAALRKGELPKDKIKIAEKLGITTKDLVQLENSFKQTKKRKVKEKSNGSEEKEGTKREPKKVESIREEIKYIKRFVGLHNKVKSTNSILNFIKALQKSIVQKLIRKTSPLAKEIQKIQDMLVSTYNKMEEDTLIRIDEKDLGRMVSLAGGEEVYPSINIIKRFIGMEGKPVEEKRVNALLKQLENYKKKKKITEDDPYLDKVEIIYRKLKGFKAGTRLSIEKAELNGLSGIVKACSCSKGLGKIYSTKGKKLRACKKKTYSDAKGKGACSHNNGLSGVLTADEIANRKFDVLSLDEPWNSLIGRPGKNFIMMIHGEPGAGKTTLLLKFVKYLSNNFYKQALFVTSEEFDSVTITEKVNELLNPKPKNLHFAGDLTSANLKDYDLVILDSINDLKLDLQDFKELKKKYPETAFILILQHTKDGQFRGGKDWEHDAQIVGKVEAGTINIYKNRFGVRESLNFFENVA
jgi:hypothetical protein